VLNDVLGTIGRVGLVPVIKIERAEDAVPLARALVEGGLPVAEITFRTAAAGDAIRRIAAELPDMILGAGTVLTLKQAEQAVNAGARFIVSPGFDPSIVDWCIAQGVVITPGVATPTEVTAALGKGLHTLKFFPAEELGGIRMLKALAGPFGDVGFVPTGGISAANLADFLRLDNVVAVGGSWIATAAMISAGQFGNIKRLAAEARQIVAEVRGGSEVSR
jgi:2-dehydro-3-deoxyphosphogluconate aldolase/(4S)-4-hydroxy-2-oxoglutarate aldolase